MNDKDVEVGLAMCYLKKMYWRITKKYPILKYDGDIVSYIAPTLWLNTEKDYEIFAKLLFKACHRHQEAAEALLENGVEVFRLGAESSRLICWFHGYFSGYLAALPEDIEIDFKLEGDKDE